MTTEVIVKANHGWPVKVTQKFYKTTSHDISDGSECEVIVDPGSTAVFYIHIVDPGSTAVFYIHSELDLLIHEIQPDELEEDKLPDIEVDPNIT
jgi:hypothetical protein